MTENEEKYSVAQIRKAFEDYAGVDEWNVPSMYENVLIGALRGVYEVD